MDGGNNEQQYYTNRSDNAYVADGALHIRAKKESYGGRNYTSARLNTNGKIYIYIWLCRVKACITI